MSSSSREQILKEGTVRRYGEQTILGLKIVKWTDFNAKLRSDATIELYADMNNGFPLYSIPLSKAAAVRIPGIQIHTKELDMKFLCNHHKKLPAAVSRKEHKLLHVIVDPQGKQVHMLLFRGNKEEIHDWFQQIALSMLEKHAGKKCNSLHEFGHKIGVAIKNKISAFAKKKNSDGEKRSEMGSQCDEFEFDGGRWQPSQETNREIPSTSNGYAYLQRDNTTNANNNDSGLLKRVCTFAPILGATASVGGFIYTVLSHTE